MIPRSDVAAPSPRPLTIGDAPISLDDLDACLGRPLVVTISNAAMGRLNSAREIAERLISTGRSIYGINTGFGKLCNVRISSDDLARLQQNLIVSHAVGVGPPAPPEIVRWMLLLKANALLAGASAISPDCVRCLVDLLNHDLLPVVPTRGSLGASGDLAPLAHLVLPLINRGEVIEHGEVVSAQAAMQRNRIAPASLGPKDGLALINGTQFMLAYAAEVIVRARRLARHADLIATLSLEAYQGSLAPFRAELVSLRPHPGILETAENVRRLMADSEILKSHANCDKVQDPYSLRCIPPVHGACRDVVRQAAATVEIELNSVTDNPVLVDEEFISGGLFHGEPLALALDHLAMALSEWANISERRTYMLLHGPDGLPPLLMKDTGLNSGFMIPQYTAAALVNECKVLCTPASIDSIPSSLGQEDHVSMGATSALKCRQVLENAETVLAIEMLCSAQALDFRLPTQPGIGPRIALETIRKTISHAEEDREFRSDIAESLAILRRQDALSAVEAVVGPLK
ncbi:MAG: histidine ammonia-lyase [Phycisphaerae bacterium]|nr:histidine ammonia-lyase [Phycisphaerae bacterium]